METTPLPGSAPPADPTAYQQWLDEIVSLKEGARLRDVSVPTLRRAERKRIINTSTRLGCQNGNQKKADTGGEQSPDRYPA